MTKRKTFTREFKLQALRLLDDGEKKPADLARELGVPRNRLYKWREQLTAKGDDTAFPGSGRRRGHSVKGDGVDRPRFHGHPDKGHNARGGVRWGSTKPTARNSSSKRFAC